MYYIYGVSVPSLLSRDGTDTILLVVDLCSSLAYFVMSQPLPKLPIKLWLLGKYTCMYRVCCEFIHVYRHYVASSVRS